ncbi:Histidine ammonia-lyase [Serratia fonticola]|uniref:Histidine ammonia-lyase n=1 Tax=Serratia fonticola TaxID=47917 RepID=A0A4U9WGV3_SERFO|nr:Histidine ammonia-lyase [Serratia fonticola]
MSRWHRQRAVACGKWRINVRGILAVEWLAACQGLDLRKGLQTTAGLEQARHLLREHVAYYDKDRFFAPDIEAASQLLAAGHLTALIPATLLP